MQQGKPSRKLYHSALQSEKITIEAPTDEKWVRGSKPSPNCYHMRWLQLINLMPRIRFCSCNTYKRFLFSFLFL